MSWVTVIWSMVASACLTLAAIRLMVWLKKRRAWVDLAFSLLALGTAAMAAGELWLMRSETAAQYATTVRWLHIPYWVAIVSLVLFTRLYLRAGRAWLAWTVCALRTLVLPLNFLVGANINYREVTGLRPIPFLGESVSIAEGVSNPWMLVAQLALVLLVVFIADAAVSAWRRGDRRMALTVGGSLLFFILAAMVLNVLIFWLKISVPVMHSLFYLGVVVAMGYEITRDLVRAGQLADDLRQSDVRYRNIFDESIEGIYRTSVDGKIIFANPAAAKMLGYDSPEDMIRSVTDVSRQVWADPGERSRLLGLVEEGGVVRGRECWFRRKDGTLIWISLSTRPGRGPDGQILYFDGFLENIDERKRNEYEMAELRLERTHLSRVLTANEISASLAHEINQPLGAILNNAETAKLLLSQAQDNREAIPEIVEDIIQDAKRAGDVVRKVRSILRKGEAHFEPLPVNALIDGALEIVHNNLSLNNVTLQSDLKPGLKDIRGDRVRLQQVLLNLVINAVDAMKEVPLRILTVRSTMEGQDNVTVSVSDSGPGIAEGNREMVFEPFFTTKKDGLGLGLPICRSIIEEHGGRIWVDNNPGGGATFSFSLKAWEEDSA